MTDSSQKLTQKDFQNWLKTALAVSIAKKGVQLYVSNVISQFHQKALKDIFSTYQINDEALCTTCTNESLLPQCSRTTRINYNNPVSFPKCRNNICHRLLLKIVHSHAYGDPSWKNTDVSRWCHCPWEIAKCYMPPDGYASSSSADETDLNGILSVMMNHLEFSADHDLKQCEMAREVTKLVRHSPDLSISDQEMKKSIDSLITFLETPTCLKTNPEAQAALIDMKKLKEAKLEISTDDITEVLKSYVKDEINSSTRLSIDELDKKRNQCLEQIIEEINKLHATKSESLDEILTAKKGALDDINKAKETSLDEMRRTNERLIHMSRSVSSNEIYESLKDELKEDLLIFNKKLYSTIPLSPLFEKTDTPFDGFYVQPSMDSLEYPLCKSRRGDIRTEIKFIGDIFRKKRTNEIYVTSKAGLGKTVFCKRLVVAWCNAHDKKTTGANFETEDVIKLMESFDYTFLVPLRETHRSDCDVDKMIQNQIITNLARSDRYTSDFLQDILTKERCLIILDGLDEWTHPTDKLDCKTNNDIPHRKARENCTIVTTSRTWKFCLLKLSTNQIDNLVQINGLSDTAAEQLSNNAFSKISLEGMEENTRDIRDFHIKMQKDSVSKFKSVPLILIHLICLWRTDHTIGDSYCEIFSNIIGLHLKRAQIRTETAERSASKMRKFDMPKCIAKNKYCQSFYELLQSLGQLAFETFFDPTRENSLVFDISTAKHFLLDKYEFCLSTGLLTQNKAVKGDFLGNSPRVSFAHKTFQEYFAALHMYSSAAQNTKIKSVVYICSSVNDIISVSNFYIFLNGMCPEKARRLSHEFCQVVALSDTVKGYRCDMGSWNYFVGYNETIKRIQSLFVECVKESIDNEYTPVRFHVEDIIIDADFQTKTYSNAMRFILKENEKDVKSVKIRDVKTKDEFRSLVNLLSTKRSVALEKLDLKCEICEESLELVLRKSVHSLKCFIIKGGKWLGNCWSHNHASITNKSLLTIWSMKQLEEIYLRNIEMTHGQLKDLLGFVSSSVNMKHIGLGFLKCNKHDDSCSEYILDLSNHSQLRMLEIGSVPISRIDINTQSLEVCYVGSFAKSNVLFEILSYLSNASKLHVFCCGFLTVQADIERMLKTIPTLTNLQHIWLINMDLGSTTFELSQNMKHIENIFMLRLKMKVESLRKLIEGVKMIPKTVRVGLYDCSVESPEEYEHEIRSLNSLHTIHVIQDVTKNQKDFVFKT